jgi:hypothetical protein
MKSACLAVAVSLLCGAAGCSRREQAPVPYGETTVTSGDLPDVSTIDSIPSTQDRAMKERLERAATMEAEQQAIMEMEAADQERIERERAGKQRTTPTNKPLVTTNGRARPDAAVNAEESR